MVTDAVQSGFMLMNQFEIRVETRLGQYAYLNQMGHLPPDHVDHWLKQTKLGQFIKLIVNTCTHNF